MFRRELQSATRHRGERAHFTDHRGNASCAQPFLHRPQNLGVASCLNQHEATGIEPESDKAGSVQVWARQTPQHDAVSRRCEPSEDASDEGGDECAIFLVAAHSPDLVQSAAREPAARQGPIDRGKSKGCHPMHRCCRPLDPPNLLAQHYEKLAGHTRQTPLLPSSLFVLYNAYCQSRPCMGLTAKLVTDHSSYDARAAS
jgi:hypothetical protein